MLGGWVALRAPQPKDQELPFKQPSLGVTLPRGAALYPGVAATVTAPPLHTAPCRARPHHPPAWLSRRLTFPKTQSPRAARPRRAPIGGERGGGRSGGHDTCCRHQEVVAGSAAGGAGR